MSLEGVLAIFRGLSSNGFRCDPSGEGEARGQWMIIEMMTLRQGSALVVVVSTIRKSGSQRAGVYKSRPWCSSSIRKKSLNKRQ